MTPKTKPRWIDTPEQAKKAEKVISMLEYKIKNGTATPEEAERYRVGMMDLVIYDWGTESYQNHVPNQIASMAEKQREKKEARRSLIAPAPERKLPKPAAAPEKVAVGAERIQLTRRAGKFAV